MSLKYWTMTDGEAIAIKDMDDDHLMNAIRMLERNAHGIAERLLSIYYLGGQPQGEMAQEAVEREFDELMEMEPLDIVKILTPYNSLIWHARRRGLLAKGKRWWE